MNPNKDILYLFDIDGTLLFSNKIDSNCFAKTFLDEYKQEFPSIDWNHFPHVTDHTIFGEGFKEVHQRHPVAHEIEDFRNKYVARLRLERVNQPEAFQSVAGVQKLFEVIREKELAHGIATGGWRLPATVKLKHVGIYEQDLILSAADSQPTREDILQTAIDSCKSKGYQWKRVVYIGDAHWDAKTCRNMGIPMIGLRKDGDHNALLDVGVSHVLSNYSDIGSFFQAAEQATVPKAPH